MQAFSNEYNQRKGEISSYIEMLKVLENDGATISDIDGNQLPVTVVQQKVCKASCYLLIYNLVEATVMNGITSIYNKIKDENLSFSQIMDKLKRVWWHARAESISSTGRNQVIETIYEYYCETLATSQLDFKNFISGVSGNMNAEGIRNVCHKYGITVVPDGSELEDVKRYRNWLAHGNKSFSEIGQDTTASALEDAVDRIFNFLDIFVSNINTYLAEEKYKAQ
ncbi:MAE_28990/MAE_18760 family HEPN-like nuclease [Vibrio alginolyticus]|uniref:MAE_28990/MAE_18760 family HEPN-like nuclease n=1 Tax=Vibrio alginolyticus TaxID=663 RepID=UPI001B82DD93|nr:MAE_28990/MAE_18760 family HEPN-like nuclease [Vibrio alginolyticus]HCG8113749.1 hypothetical protein [Vibrio parahaemolyticus]MBY7695765.1 hypothetical protein [Vibrio alginolyticus]MCS0163475.1 MAE_28990/MAE_18760 family HEPN-like nuclease [Vibrio alginolyticus]MCS0211717.1 MAE_28990/MAE_18760 family HEPN-like nuclease [Vibrio alginolyticus]HBC3969992.1 hypothetical protein [Vibrio alginolyticus]